ncbi:MAG TPA: hypothetical protein VM030_10140 [Acidimicrobiales bacterium]|nr:hypothetical protein [Acidimicrobiales bacterium]
MAVTAGCIVLLLVGLVVSARWGGRATQPDTDASEPDPAPRAVAQCYLDGLTVAVASGVGAGILVAGAGGRLVMRLLAVTAGPGAQGVETEAEQIVGKITLDGTIGFVVFTGLFFGLATGGVYALIRRWLPGGWWRGIAFGALLLVVVATRADPLRADNPDFDIVGPGLVAVVAFIALGLAHGVTVTALAERYRGVVALPREGWRRAVPYLPLLLMLPVFPVAVFLLLLGLVVVGLSQSETLVRGVRHPRFRRVGQVVTALVAAVCLPGFVIDVADILTR